MKILQIIPYFVPNWEYGGPIRYVYHLSKELITLGNEITVFTTKIDKETLTLEKIAGIDVIRTKTALKIQGYWITPKIISDIPRNHFDIVHFHSLRNFQVEVLFNYFRKKSIPIIINAHGAISDRYQDDNFLVQKLKLIQNLYIKYILKNATKLIAVSKIEILDYLRFGSNLQKISIIPLGASLPTSKIQETRNSTYRKLKKFLKSNNYILFVGRIVERKGLKFLIEGFTKLLNFFPNLKLIIIGKNFGYKKNLVDLIQKNKISQNVIFLGIVDENILSMAYQNCKFLVYPSKYEVFGVAPLEAATFSKPSIITDNMGVKDIFIDNKMGYVIKYGDSQSLFEKMNYLIENPKQTIKLGENAFESVKNKYLWKNIAQKLFNIYKNLVKS